MPLSSTTPLDEAIARWSLSEVRPIADTPTSRVYRVQRSDGSLAALKILKPYGADEIVGARLMIWYDGDGAAAIYDIDGQAILMEWLEFSPLGDLVRAGNDDEATGILCTVATQLHRPRPNVPDDLDPVRRRFEALFLAKPDMWPESHRPLAARAISIATTLLETSDAAIPLHGDFHHDNVVGCRRGWAAIDPKGLIGDPHYEVANVFRNPLGADELAQQPERIDKLASTFAAELGLDRTRLLKWAAAHSALSACWDFAAGNSIASDLLMLPRLLTAVDRAG